MNTRVKYTAKSFKKADGRWVSSGTVTYSDTYSSIVVTKHYNDSYWVSKDDANTYFVKRAKKELSGAN